MKTKLLLIALLLPICLLAQTKTKVIYSGHCDEGTRHSGYNFPYKYHDYNVANIFKCTYTNNKLVKISDSSSGEIHYLVIYKNFILESKNDSEVCYSCKALFYKGSGEYYQPEPCSIKFFKNNKTKMRIYFVDDTNGDITEDDYY